MGTRTASTTRASRDPKHPLKNLLKPIVPEWNHATVETATTNVLCRSSLTQNSFAIVYF